MLKIIFNLILGLFFGLFLGWKFLKHMRKEHHGPNSKDIVGQVFDGGNGKYYKFTPEICACPLI